MHSRDYRDILGGGVLIVVGMLVALYALTNLRLGTVSQMGPGMFPAALGLILAMLGLAILVPAFFRRGPLPKMDLVPLAALLLSIFSFAILLRPFGLVPAILVQTAIASRADSKLSPVGTLILAAVLAAGAVLIFRIGLGMPVSIVSWPW